MNTSATGTDEIVLVFEDGTPHGVADKLLAHSGNGLLHQAVSVQLVDRHGNWLLQRRSGGKELFAGRWANSFCTHPRPGEQLVDCARRRLGEELGPVDVEELTRAGSFMYRARDPESGLVEFEHDTVFIGLVDGDLAPNPHEISDICFLPSSEVASFTKRPTAAPWFAGVAELAAGALARVGE